MLNEKPEMLYYATEDSLEELFEYESFLYLDKKDMRHLTNLGRAMAEDYFSNHDGWEASWPITFHIFDGKKELIGKVEVGMETEPVFYARKVH